MHKALYRKWRPADFDTVCGQDHITEVLKYQVSVGKTSHAYLFCGSRGTGKTTCAKILAKAVNCEAPENGNPCNRCAACRSINEGTATDVVEMDAASNTGVDNVRDLIDEVQFSPAALKYRVYIIDEVHMLSTSAFNALLKTLEEPPSYVVFILATTEMQKLPSTIVSRCQRYEFRRISTPILMARMREIAESEGIALDDSGAQVIARAAVGGMRDAVSLLELCAGNGARIDATVASEIIGSGDRGFLYELVRAVKDRQYEKVYGLVAEVVMRSKDLTVIWQDLMDIYRDLLVVKTCKDAREYLDLTEAEYETLRKLAADFTVETLTYHSRLLDEALQSMQRSAATKRTTAELTLTRMCDPKLSLQTDALLARIARLEEEIDKLKLGIVTTEAPRAESTRAEAERPASPRALNVPEEPPVRAKTPTKSEPPAPTASEDGAFTALSCWSEVLENIAERNPSVAGFLSKTRAYYSPEKGFMLSVVSDFVIGIINTPNILNELKAEISSKLGRNIMAEPFEIVSTAKANTYPLIEELEAAIDEE